MMRYAKGSGQGHMCQNPRTLLKEICVRVVTTWKDETAAELVEAAVVLPLLLMLLLGIVSFGRAYNVYQTMTRAAREGARELVLTGCATCSDALTAPSAASVQTNFVNPALTAANLDPTNSTYTGSYSTTYVYLNPNQSSGYICGVQISFKYPYKLMLPFTTLNLSTITLSTTVQMRMENPPSTCNVGGAVP